MAGLLKNAAAKREKAPTVIGVNSNTNITEKFRGWDRKSLIELDGSTDFTSIEIGESEWDSTTIYNLIIGMKDGDYAFPLSKEFTKELEANGNDVLLDGQFFLTNKMGPKDKEGEYPYTGPLYMSFGKPAGLTFTKRNSLVEPEPAVRQN